jgi:hypothetical protein
LSTPPLNSTAVGCRKLRVLGLGGEALELGSGAELAGEEGGQVAGDRRVLRIGQAELGERGRGRG